MSHVHSHLNPHLHDGKSSTSSAITNGSAIAPTVLGQSTPRIHVAGKIRAGIKVLTRKAAEQPEARAIYERGLAADEPFGRIEKSITDALPQLKHPLVPQNVPWFTVRPQDFSNPELARELVRVYGEDRGEGRHLYRFPVVFPSDHWPTVMPHELVTWAAHERRFWSEYSLDGSTRYCKCYAPASLRQSAHRTVPVRVFGGRKTMHRPENNGVCEPEQCGEYQRRECNLNGRFLFFVPGIPSISVFQLHTTSFYAMSAAIRMFESVAFMRGGRISGFLDRKRTTFYLTKVLREVTRIDDDGKAVRVPQWIIELEAPVDVTALLRQNETADDTVLNDATLASQILEAPQPVDMQVLAVPQIEPTAAAIPAGAQPGSITSPTQEDVLVLAQSYGIEPERYQAYADRRWGAGWKVSPFGRRRAREELSRYRNDAEGYRDKIDAEMQTTTTSDEAAR